MTRRVHPRTTARSSSSFTIEGCMNGCLTFTNIISLICSLVVLCLGLWLCIDSSYVQSILKNSAAHYVPYLLTANYYLILGGLLTGLALLTVFFSCCGCLGACKEISWMVGVYTFYIILVVLLLLGGCVLWFLARSTVLNWLKTEMLSTMPSYDPLSTTSRITVCWDLIQTNYGCCGVSTGANIQPYAAWYNNTLINQASTFQYTPSTCCTAPPCYLQTSNTINTMFYRVVDPGKVFTKDCYTLIVEDIVGLENTASIIVLVCFLLVLIYFICLIHCKCMLKVFDSTLNY